MTESMGDSGAPGISRHGEGSSNLVTEGGEQTEHSSLGDVGSSPSWPVFPPESAAEPMPPPVGLSWSLVAAGLGIDIRILEHDGVIVLAGEYVPSPGFVIDPKTLLARAARVGDRVLYHSYFIGETTAGEFNLRLALDPDTGSIPNVVVRSAAAPIIGLFPDERDAERARRHLLGGSIGYGVSMHGGTLGTELRVERTDVPGLVATVIAGHRGAIISVGGQAL